MIVDLHLEGRSVVIVGGGRQALKKTRALLQERCRVTVISESAAPEIEEMASSGMISLVRARLAGAADLRRYSPFLVMSATDDAGLNRKIVEAAREVGSLAFSSDCPRGSDFASVSVISIGGMVDIAVSTGGRSPVMAKVLKSEIEPAVRGLITAEHINRIRVQQIAREIAMSGIESQEERRRFLYRIAEDRTAEQLIKDGDEAGVRRRISSLLESWT